LFNGYLSIQNNKWDIDISSKSADFSVQTGPLLIDNERPRKLIIKNDKNARRMFAATDNTGETYFGTVFLINAQILGPYLVDLPEIVNMISEKENIMWVKAINLDGGSASAFLGENLFLQEVNPVGSWWCFSPI